MSNNQTKFFDPNFVSGLADGESTFYLAVSKNSNYKLGWRTIPSFSIELHGKDSALLKQVQSFFGVGTIKVRKKKNGSVVYSVYSLEALTNIIIPHFNKYPLLTQKRADFYLFKSAIELMNKKEHLTIVGLHKIVRIRASMNKGLTEELKTAFRPGGKEIIPLKRPLGEGLGNITPGWLAGFAEAEGCFHVQINKSKTTNTGYSVGLMFNIGQHSRDAKLLASMVKFFGCGKFRESPKNPSCLFVVAKFSDLLGKIIPLFAQYKLQGSKRLDYLDFCKIAELVKNKVHLTNEGLEQIIYIKKGMNKGRNHRATLDRSSPGSSLSPSSVGEVISKTNPISRIQNRTFHTHVKAAKRIGPHDKDVISVIIGALLGNCAASRLVEGTRFVFRQSIAQKDYSF
jgi:hypothetical protein